MFHHPQQGAGRRIVVLDLLATVLLYPRGFCWLPLLEEWAAALCSTCSLLELPHPVLQAFFVELAPNLCVCLSHPRCRTLYLSLLNFRKLLSACFFSLSGYCNCAFQYGLLHQISVIYKLVKSGFIIQAIIKALSLLSSSINPWGTPLVSSS